MGGFYHEGTRDSSLKIQFCDELDRGLAYGEACFETFRVVRGEVFALRAHVRRMRRGLDAFGIHLAEPVLEGLFDQAICRAAELGEDMLLRLTISGGKAPWGLMRTSSPEAYVQMRPVRAVSGTVTLKLCEWPFAPKPRPAKFVGDYADTLRALGGHDGLDVLFHRDGLLLSAATANLLVCREGRWLTPDGPGILPGVVRAHLMAQGLVHPAKIGLEDLRQADALVLCNAGRFLRPVAQVLLDGSPMQFDARHPAMGGLVASFEGHPGVPPEVFACP